MHHLTKIKLSLTTVWKQYFTSKMKYSPEQEWKFTTELVSCTFWWILHHFGNKALLPIKLKAELYYNGHLQKYTHQYEIMNMKSRKKMCHHNMKDFIFKNLLSNIDSALKWHRWGIWFKWNTINTVFIMMSLLLNPVSKQTWHCTQ